MLCERSSWGLGMFCWPSTPTHWTSWVRTCWTWQECGQQCQRFDCPNTRPSWFTGSPGIARCGRRASQESCRGSWDFETRCCCWITSSCLVCHMNPEVDQRFQWWSLLNSTQSAKGYSTPWIVWRCLHQTCRSRLLRCSCRTRSNSCYKETLHQSSWWLLGPPIMGKLPRLWGQLKQWMVCLLREGMWRDPSQGPTIHEWLSVGKRVERAPWLRACGGLKCWWNLGKVPGRGDFFENLRPCCNW